MTEIKYRYRLIARWAVLIVCLGYIAMFFWKSRDDLDLVFNLSFLQIATAVLLMVIYLFFHGLRFRMIIVKCGARRIGILDWFKIFIIGRFFNQLLPQTGNVYRSITLKRYHSITHTRYITGFLSYAWMDTVVNFLLAAGVLAVMDPGFCIFGINGILLSLMAASILTVLPFLLHQFMGRVRTPRSRKLAWALAKLEEVICLSLNNLSDLGYLLRFTGYALVIFTTTVFLFFLLFRGFGHSLEIGDLTLFYVLYKLSTFVNITPGNLGLRELMYGILSSEVEAGMAAGIMVSATIRIINIALLLVLGLLFSAPSQLNSHILPGDENSSTNEDA